MQDHKPYISPSAKVKELSVVSIFMGCFLGIIFGVASLYLVLKVGLTVSASIPIAVISISLFRVWSDALGFLSRKLSWWPRFLTFQRRTILENNIVQTAGSSGESIAFGIGITMPALYVLGYNMDLTRTMTVAILGGILGILMMIPLRRGLVVKEHGKLAFPEGTACAEVLVAGETGGTNAKTIFMGFGVGAFFKFLAGEGGLGVIKNILSKPISFFKGAVFSAEMAPELMGVGYIIGPRVAWTMFSGGVLAYLVLIPAIHLFGDSLSQPLFPATMLIKDMSAGQVRNYYVLYIGAGAVASAGILSMIRVLPMIAAAFVKGFKDLLGSRKDAAHTTSERTESDLPMWLVIVGCIGLIIALALVPSMHLSLLTAPLILIFGFLFVTVSSRLVGEIGSSANPISGMTVATLLMTCLIFLYFGMTSGTEKVAALMIAAVVCVASSNGGTTAQDLKTGFLVGATPKNQQIAILFGAMISAVVLAFAIRFFNDASTVFAKKDFGDYRVSSTEFKGKEKLFGYEAQYDSNEYNAVFLTPELTPKDPNDGHEMIPPGKYLTDDAGKIIYLVDPGINGSVTQRDPAPGETTGQQVTKLDSPKARLMSIIIDGILTQKLPWGLLLLGVCITLVFELGGVAAPLALAVGVYLPLSTTAPIALGGLINWLVNRGKQSSGGHAESDSSPGVLFSSGLIAGGAIAGSVLAIFAGIKGAEFLEKKVGHHVDFLAKSDLAATLSFLIIAAGIYLVGKEKLLKAKT